MFMKKIKNITFEKKFFEILRVNFLFLSILSTIVFIGCSAATPSSTSLGKRQQVNSSNYSKKTNQERYEEDEEIIRKATTLERDKTYKQDLTEEFNTISGSDRKGLEVKNKNLYAPTLEEVIDGVSAKVVDVDNTPVEITNNILKSPSKELKIALVVPTTGKYASIGQMVSESAMLTIAKSKYANIGQINVYNIGALPVQNWRNDEEVRRLINDKNDIVIGSIFPETTEKLISAVGTDTYFISFINDDTLAQKYPNLTIMSMDDSYKVLSLFEYLKDNKRQFLTLILPATKKGYNLNNIAKALASKHEIMIISSQFYQEDNKKSMSVASNGVSKNFNATYFINANGKFITENYKTNKKKQKALLASENGEDIAKKSISTKKTMRVSTNAIYIEANEKDLSQIVNNLEKNGILNKNVEIFSNAIIPTHKRISSNFDGLNLIGYNHQFVGNFNNEFITTFGKEPNYFAYLTHDALTLLFYSANEGDMLPNVIYNENGFRGALDEFRFTRSGIVERRQSIYRVQNQVINRVFIPDNYYKLANIKDLKYIK